MPRRTVGGLDPNRLALLIAVLGRRAGIGLAGHDVYASLAGGLSVDEPGARPATGDGPRVVDARSAGSPRARSPVGEVGLLGELRPVVGLERRLREAARLGFERAIVPARGLPGPDAREAREGRSDGIGLVPVATLRDALAAALLPAPGTGAEARLEPAAAL